MSRILSTFAPSPPSLLDALGIFASAGDAIFLPLLLRLFMPCRGNLRLMVRGIAGHYYEKMASSIITRLITQKTALADTDRANSVGLHARQSWLMK
jgi:hypothetical protein